MEIAGVGYLYTTAAIGIAFASLSILTMIFRQMLGGNPTKFDSFVTRTLIQLGFMTALGSILPPLLALLEIPAATNWRVSSAAMAIILGWWALSFPRRRREVNPTRMPRPVWCFAVVLDFAALALAANAIVAPAERLVGIYAAAVTAIMIGSGVLFLSTIRVWYEPP